MPSRGRRPGPPSRKRSLWPLEMPGLRSKKESRTSLSVRRISLGLRDFAKREGIGLTIVGPEAPLVEGIVDTFQAADLPCFGPIQAASRLEGSKVFAKDFLARHGIPTAQYRTFKDLHEAKKYVRSQGTPLVIKADGLAAGKGVIIAQSETQAFSALEGMLSGRAFGEAGKRVVIEECLEGEEASFICMVEGEHMLPLATSQDHKARDDGDKGPNTGGMGAYSPAPVIRPEIHSRIMEEVITPTVRGLSSEGTPYVGFLYAGLMILSDGTPKVLEYNCRLGDPETQPILLRMKSDLVELCLAAMEGRLDQVQVQWDERPALGVVMAAGGYPEGYRKGDKISGLPPHDQDDLKVFHAGTALKDDAVVTQGGRVLCVTALGSSVSQAQTRAYALVREITWDGVYYRRDIGYRAIERERTGV